MKDLVAETLPDNGSISDLESDLQTDQSVVGSPLEHSAGTNKGGHFFTFVSCFFDFYNFGSR